MKEKNKQQLLYVRSVESKSLDDTYIRIKETSVYRDGDPIPLIQLEIIGPECNILTTITANGLGELRKMINIAMHGNIDGPLK